MKKQGSNEKSVLNYINTLIEPNRFNKVRVVIGN